MFARGYRAKVPKHFSSACRKTEMYFSSQVCLCHSILFWWWSAGSPSRPEFMQFDQDLLKPHQISIKDSAIFQITNTHFDSLVNSWSQSFLYNNAALKWFLKQLKTIFFWGENGRERLVKLEKCHKLENWPCFHHQHVYVCVFSLSCDHPQKHDL